MPTGPSGRRHLLESFSPLAHLVEHAEVSLIEPTAVRVTINSNNRIGVASEGIEPEFLPTLLAELRRVTAHLDAAAAARMPFGAS